jgi:hypothetical protein
MTMGIWRKSRVFRDHELSAVLCFLMAICLTSSSEVQGTFGMQEWQVPKKMLPHPQIVVIDSLDAAATFDFAVVCLDPSLSTERIHGAAERWLSRLPDHGKIVANVTSDADDEHSCCQIQGNTKAVCIFLRHGISPKLRDQHNIKGAYSLAIDTGSVHIMSTNEDGAFYALSSTLLQVYFDAIMYMRGQLRRGRTTRKFESSHVRCSIYKKKQYL